MSDLDLLRLSKDHPKRPVNWRWELAKYLTMRKKAKLPILRGMVDSDTYKACRFQLALAKCLETGKINRIRKNHMYEYVAYDIYEGSVSDKSSRYGLRSKHILEALLLSKMSYDEISEIMAMPKESIEIYENWFFNVKDKMQSYAWIMDQAIGEIRSDGKLSDIATLWKIYAYFGGPNIIRFVLTSISPDSISMINEGCSVRKFLENDIRDQMGIKAAVAARTIPINERTVRTIFNFYTNIKEAEASEISASDRNQTTGSELITSFSKLLEQMSWSVHNDQSTSLLQSSVYTSNSPAEPRVSELVDVYLGRCEANNLAASISNISQPEPSSSNSGTSDSGSIAPVDDSSEI